MSKQFGQPQLHPTAPPSEGDEFQREAPPPSYEECLRTTMAPSPQQCHQTQQQQHQQPHHHQFVTSAPSAAYGYTNPYQAHMLQQQTYYNTGIAVPDQTSHVNNVLHFHKRAQIRTTATGAISVPPPPPGCAPTPGQLAAMAGQPVVVKKDKKKLFF